MKLFVLDVGNTHSKYGLWEDGKIKYSEECDTISLADLELPDNIPVAAATVVPKAKKQLKRKDIFWVEHDVVTGIDLSLVNAAQLGTDRIANLAALACNAQLPAIIIDCGTAVTVEVLDENKVFRGGHIAPGRFLQRKALADYTAQLPFLPVNQTRAKTFGLNTEDAIMLGTDIGLIGAVREFIADTKRELGINSCQVYVTGGDSNILMENINGLIPVSTDFTLLGIAAIWVLNNC